MVAKKTLYDYKIGEIIPEVELKKIIVMDIMKHPIKLVKIGYTYQDKNGVQMETSLIHNEFIEDDDDE